ncbi:serine/threonine-protein kinase [Streptomyces tritici]|uniref:serine/threonine-protein kinase n=1 Tax=Streptomyces tritici TaxID=2054410 RepID=UPI003AEF8C0F
MSDYPITVPTGHRIGPWTVERPLGAGAFGSVYAAVRSEDSSADDGLPARAALKFLPTGTRTPRQLRHLRDLAEREVELLGRLRSPRLIRMYEALTVDDPEHPELDGATVLVLEEAADSLQTALPGLPAADRARVLTQVCEGLAQLHGAGWVHGDLKPGNVLLMADGSVRLGDFSTASELEGTHAYATAFATADYTPPELLWSDFGEHGTRIRPTADLWAFGVLAHLVLTGGHPLPGGTPSARRDAALRYARGDEELRLSPELSEAWREIVGACLSRSHEDRARGAGRTAESLLPRVQEAAEGRPARRSRRPLLTAAAAVLTLAVTALGVTLLPDETPRAKAKATPKAGATVTATAAGYERCTPRAVCFFSAPDGGGEMCAWEGDDPDWFDGQTDCSWADRTSARSVFNNGGPDPKGFVHVAYFAEAGLQRRLGCVERGRRQNLPTPAPVLSHTWAKRC